MFSFSDAYSQLPLKSSKPRFSVVSSVGIINGSSETSISIQSVAGFSCNQSFAGIGLGVDHYMFRTIPLFAEIRQDFGKKSRKLFLYADGGYNFNWLTEQSSFGDYDHKGGSYYESGFGFKSVFKNEGALLVSFGYNNKQVRKELKFTGCPFSVPCLNPADKYSYKMTRFIFRVGYQF